MTQFPNNCHPIRLRGPWESQVLAPAPSSADPAIAVRRIKFTRFFNRPTGLMADDRVDLVFKGVKTRGAVRLNGNKTEEIDVSDSSLRLDITQQLIARNLIEVELELALLDKPFDLDTATSKENELLVNRFLGEVQLEIFTNIPSR